MVGSPRIHSGHLQGEFVHPLVAIFPGPIVQYCQLLILFCLYTSDGLGYHKLDFRALPGISQKMGLRQVEQGFSSFFANILPHLMIFQCGSAKSSYMAKKVRNALLNLH